MHSREVILRQINIKQPIILVSGCLPFGIECREPNGSGVATTAGVASKQCLEQIWQPLTLKRSQRSDERVVTEIGERRRRPVL